jgi:hypothetical protein
MTMKTSVIQTFLRSSNLPYVPLADGLRLQVIPDISFLSRCQKHHFAAFVRDPGMLVVWDDDPEHIIGRAEQIEQHLVGMIWRSEGMKEEGDYKTALAKSTFTSKAPTINISGKETLDDGSEPDRQFSDKPRRVLLFQPILMAITGILVILTIGVGWRKVAIELKVDHNFMRCLLLVVVPLQLWLGWVWLTHCFTRVYADYASSSSKRLSTASLRSSVQSIRSHRTRSSFRAFALRGSLATICPT